MKKLISILLSVALCSFVATPPGEKSLPPSSILVNVGWESGTILQNLFAPYSLCTRAYAGAISDSFAREGTHSARFELRDTDETCGASKRSELYIQQSNVAISSRLQWYAFSEYIPAWMPDDKIAEVHWQIHHAGSAGSPLVTIWIQNGRYILVQSYSPTALAKQTQRIQDLGPVIKGQWVDWVIYYKYRLDPSGQLSVWQNGTQVANVPGVNFNAVRSTVDTSLLVPEAHPYEKFGIYKSPWSHLCPCIPNKTVVYIDRVMGGDSTAVLADFLPTVPPVPAPTPDTTKKFNGPFIIRKV